MMSQSNQQVPPVTAVSSSVEVWADTNPGKRRDANEDNVFPRAGASRGPIRLGVAKLAAKGHLAVVADGVGGAQAGERVSRHAVEYVADGYYDGQHPDAGINLKRAVESANHWLHDLIRRDPASSHSATTLTAAAIQGGKLHVAHVGDSRAYLIRSGKITQITKDHTLAQEKFEAGQIQRREDIPHDPGHSTLTRSLGTGPQVQVDLMQQPLEPGDIIVLCSDGLYDELSDNEIRTVAERQSPKKAVSTLIRRANQAGGNDNISVAVMRLSGGSQAAGWPAWQRALALFLAVSVVCMMIGLAIVLARSLWGTAQTPAPGAATATVEPGGDVPSPDPTVAAFVTDEPTPRAPTSTPIDGTESAPTVEPTATPEHSGQYGRPFQMQTAAAATATAAAAAASPTPPRPTTRPSPTPPPAPELVSPPEEDVVSSARWFEWEWDYGELAEGQAFDLLIVSEEEKEDLDRSVWAGVIAPTQNTSVYVDVPGVATVVNHGEGDYYWTVIVVQTDPYKRIGQWGDLWEFVFEFPPPTNTPTATPIPPTPTPTKLPNPDPSG